MLYAGYDPGGNGTHGVAVIDVNKKGKIDSIIDRDVVEDMKSAWSWFSKFEGLAAFGIDTLLAWSEDGRRSCDDYLRRSYGGTNGNFGKLISPSTVIPQNSLYSAMTINGAMLAKRACNAGYSCYESHPKLMIGVLDLTKSENKSIDEKYRSILADGSLKVKHRDDIADAIVAAWCAAQGHRGNWRRDLFKEFSCGLQPVADGVSYPWPG